MKCAALKDYLGDPYEDKLAAQSFCTLKNCFFRIINQPLRQCAEN